MTTTQDDRPFTTGSAPRVGSLLSRLIPIVLLTLGLVVTGNISPLRAQDASAGLGKDNVEDGWVHDAHGMRHYSGLSCPNEIGLMSRTKVMPSGNDSVAGCLYEGDDGVTAVLRQHPRGDGAMQAQKFLDNYRKAGFAPINLSGVAESGISFRMRINGGHSWCETFWYLSGADKDFTLWLAYELPKDEDIIGRTFQSFTQALRLYN